MESTASETSHPVQRIVCQVIVCKIIASHGDFGVAPSFFLKTSWMEARSYVWPSAAVTGC